MTMSGNTRCLSSAEQGVPLIFYILTKFKDSVLCMSQSLLKVFVTNGGTKVFVPNGGTKVFVTIGGMKVFVMNRGTKVFVTNRGMKVLRNDKLRNKDFCDK